MFHLEDRYLFTGDSLAWFHRDGDLGAFRNACWYSWSEQTSSLGRFADSDHRFDRLFCGHGWSHDASADEFHSHLADLVARMPEM